MAGSMSLRWLKLSEVDLARIMTVAIRQDILVIQLMDIPNVRVIISHVRAFILVRALLLIAPVIAVVEIDAGKMNYNHIIYNG